MSSKNEKVPVTHKQKGNKHSLRKKHKVLTRFEVAPRNPIVTSPCLTGIWQTRVLFNDIFSKFTNPEIELIAEELNVLNLISLRINHVDTELLCWLSISPRSGLDNDNSERSFVKLSGMKLGDNSNEYTLEYETEFINDREISETEKEEYQYAFFGTLTVNTSSQGGPGSSYSTMSLTFSDAFSNYLISKFGIGNLGPYVLLKTDMFAGQGFYSERYISAIDLCVEKYDPEIKLYPHNAILPTDFSPRFFTVLCNYANLHQSRLEYSRYILPKTIPSIYPRPDYELNIEHELNRFFNSSGVEMTDDPDQIEDSSSVLLPIADTVFHKLSRIFGRMSLQYSASGGGQSMQWTPFWHIHEWMQLSNVILSTLYGWFWSNADGLSKPILWWLHDMANFVRYVLNEELYDTLDNAMKLRLEKSLEVLEQYLFFHIDPLVDVTDRQYVLDHFVSSANKFLFYYKFVIKTKSLAVGAGISGGTGSGTIHIYKFDKRYGVDSDAIWDQVYHFVFGVAAVGAGVLPILSPSKEETTLDVETYLDWNERDFVGKISITKKGVDLVLYSIGTSRMVISGSGSTPMVIESEVKDLLSENLTFNIAAGEQVLVGWIDTKPITTIGLMLNGIKQQQEYSDEFENMFNFANRRVFTNDCFHFEFGESLLSADGMQAIKRFCCSEYAMFQLPSTHITLCGYADTKDDFHDNTYLSAVRAVNVLHYILDLMEPLVAFLPVRHRQPFIKIQVRDEEEYERGERERSYKNNIIPYAVESIGNKLAPPEETDWPFEMPLGYWCIIQAKGEIPHRISDRDKGLIDNMKSSYYRKVDVYLDYLATFSFWAGTKNKK